MIENIITIALIAIVSIFLIRKGYKAKVNKMLLFLVTRAETSFGDGTGKLKYHAVTTWIYEKLPSLVTFLFTDKEIDEMIEVAVEDMKKYLESNVAARELIIK